MNFRKLTTPTFLWTSTGNGTRNKKAVEITAGQIKQWAAEGKTRRDMAKCLGISYGYVCRRINESDSLSQAFKRGKAKAENKL